MSWLESYLDLLCAYRRQMGIVLLFMLTLGILNLVTVVWGTPGTGSHVLSVINTALIVVFGAIVGALYYRCGQRTEYGQRDA